MGDRDPGCIITSPSDQTNIAWPHFDDPHFNSNRLIIFRLIISIFNSFLMHFGSSSAILRARLTFYPLLFYGLFFEIIKCHSVEHSSVHRGNMNMCF